jgi:hypothetical protein
MIRLWQILASIALAAGVFTSRAADPSEKNPVEENSKENGKKLSTEEEKESRRTNSSPSRAENDKRREQLKNMTSEERATMRKQIKERLEKRISELRGKQTNATLTAQESRELERREQILKRFEQDGSGTLRIERPKPVLTNSPADK